MSYAFEEIQAAMHGASGESALIVYKAPIHDIICAFVQAAVCAYVM